MLPVCLCFCLSTSLISLISLPACHHATCYNDRGSKTLSQPPIKAFFIGVALVTVCLCSSRIETRHKLTWELSAIVSNAIILIIFLLSRSLYWLCFQTSYCMRLGEPPENTTRRNSRPMEDAQTFPARRVVLMGFHGCKRSLSHSCFKSHIIGGEE